MAERTPVNISDLVLLTGTVITQEHYLTKCQSVWHRINKIFSYLDRSDSGHLKMPFVIIFMHLSETKYAINLIGDSAVCYVPIY